MAKKKITEKVEETIVENKNSILDYIKSFVSNHFGKGIVGVALFFVIGYFYGDDKASEVKEVLKADSVAVVLDTVVVDTVRVDTVTVDTVK